MAGPSSRHYKYARLLAQGKTMTEAAIEAGFSPKTANDKAYKWVGKSRDESQYPELYDLVQEIRGKANEDSVDTIKKLKEWLSSASIGGTMDLALGDGVYMPKPVKDGDRLRAAEILIKLLPDVKPETEVNVNIGSGEIDVSKLSDEELEQYLALIRKAKE